MDELWASAERLLRYSEVLQRRIRPGWSVLLVVRHSPSGLSWCGRRRPHQGVAC